MAKGSDGLSYQLSSTNNQKAVIWMFLPITAFLINIRLSSFLQLHGFSQTFQYLLLTFMDCGLRYPNLLCQRPF